MAIEAFFDEAYRATEKYWWKGAQAYSTSADDHANSPMTQAVLRYAVAIGPGRALDMGSRHIDLGLPE